MRQRGSPQGERLEFLLDSKNGVFDRVTAATDLFRNIAVVRQLPILDGQIQNLTLKGRKLRPRLQYTLAESTQPGASRRNDVEQMIFMDVHNFIAERAVSVAPVVTLTFFDE